MATNLFRTQFSFYSKEPNQPWFVIWFCIFTYHHSCVQVNDPQNLSKCSGRFWERELYYYIIITTKQRMWQCILIYVLTWFANTKLPREYCTNITMCKALIFLKISWQHHILTYIEFRYQQNIYFHKINNLLLKTWNYSFTSKDSLSSRRLVADQRFISSLLFYP